MALSNEVLTAQLQALQQAVQSLTDDVRSALPRMNTATENLQISSKEMDERLKLTLNPLIEAQLIDNLKLMAQSNLDKFSALDEVVQKLVSASQQQQADVKSAAQISVDQLSKFEPALQNLNDAIAGMKNDLIEKEHPRHATVEHAGAVGDNDSAVLVVGHRCRQRWEQQSPRAHSDAQADDVEENLEWHRERRIIR